MHRGNDAGYCQPGVYLIGALVQAVAPASTVMTVPVMLRA